VAVRALSKYQQQLLGLLLRRAAVPLLILAAALSLRLISQKKFGAVPDEDLTRAITGEIWKGNLSNNWKYASEVPPAFRRDCYNFSSYMYADALFVGPHDPRPLYGDRLFSAICGTLAIGVFYLVALRLFGSQIALASLATMTVIPILVQDAHYARAEAFVTLLCALVYLLSIQLLRAPSRVRYLVPASFCGGLLIAAKISLLPMALIPIICLYAAKRANKSMFLAWILSVAAGAFAGVPDAFFHPRAYWRGVQMLLRQYSWGHPPHSLIDSSHCWQLLMPYFWQTVGPLFCIFCLAGIVRLLKQRKYVHIAILALPVCFYLVFFSLERVFFERNLSHIVPVMAILCSFGLFWVADAFPQRLRHAGALGLLVVVLVRPAWVSGRLVFLAMRPVNQERVNRYEETLMAREQLTMDPPMSLLAPWEVDDLVGRARSSQRDFLVPVFDYNDGYTRKNLATLRQRLSFKEVGYLPSLFANFSTNTLIAYHSPSRHYLRLSSSAAGR
jgi:Dolichyl-phosphate-mannose-protein mannosyltransferase